jgi:hypothetical protein
MERTSPASCLAVVRTAGLLDMLTDRRLGSERRGEGDSLFTHIVLRRGDLVHHDDYRPWWLLSLFRFNTIDKLNYHEDECP